MNGFLVVYRGQCDDVPVRLFATRSEASKLARELVEYYKGSDVDGSCLGTEDDPHHPDVERSLAALSLDVGTFCCISVTEFRDGQLRRSVTATTKGAV